MDPNGHCSVSMSVLGVIRSVVAGFLPIFLELATPPRGSDDEGLAICFMGANYQLNSSAVSAQASIGGDQFNINNRITPVSIETVEHTTFWDILKNDTFFQDPELLRTFTDIENTNHALPWWDLLNSPAAHGSNSSVAREECGQRDGADWAHCSSECLLLWANWRRNSRVELSLEVRHPPAGSTPPELPIIWTAPVKLQGNSSLVVSGSSKLGAVCERPVLHTFSTPTTLVDACAVAAAQGIPMSADQPSADQCLSSILSHRNTLVQAAAASTNETAAATPLELPEALQWPPVVEPWPSQATPNTACPPGEIRGLRNPQECISCLWGTEVATASGDRCECGQSSYPAPVGNRACSDPLHVGNNEVPVSQLPERLCSFFKQEYNLMLQGELPSEVVAREYVGAFSRLANTVVDVHRLEELQRHYYSSMLIDERYPNIPTREHGVWNICSRCFEDGTFIDERTKQRVTSNDYRYQATHVFRWIGFALSDIGYTCAGLWDPEAPTKTIYGPYNARQCAGLPDPAPHLLQ